MPPLLVLADATAQQDASLRAELHALRAAGEDVVRVAFGPEASRVLADADPSTRLHVHGARLGLLTLGGALAARGAPYTVRVLHGELDDGALTRPLRDLDDAARLVMPSRWHVRQALDRDVPRARVFLLPQPMRLDALVATAPPPPTTLRRIAAVRGASDAPGAALLQHALERLRAHAVPPDVHEVPLDCAPSRRHDLLARADLVIALDTLSTPAEPPHGASDVLPPALVEAAALRRPIAAAALPALEDLVADGVNGLLFPLGDTAALTALLLRLLRRPHELQRLGEAGPALAAAHDETVFAERWRTDVWR